MKTSSTSSRKRFYKTVSVDEEEGGFAVKLDGRRIKTPAGRPLLLPTKALAEAVAAEWAAQGENIVIEELPLTRLSNSTIDGVAGREAEVLDDIMRFAASDLIYYRANSPVELVSKQSAGWDPVLSWVTDRFDAPFRITESLQYVDQPSTSLANLRNAIGSLNPFQLAAFHVMTASTGSALLPLAYINVFLTLSEAWAAALIDEDWQKSQWGEDYDAGEVRRKRFQEMKSASQFFRLASTPNTAR